MNIQGYVITGLFMCLFCFKENEKNMFSGIVYHSSLCLFQIRQTIVPITSQCDWVGVPLTSNRLGVGATSRTGMSAWHKFSNQRGQMSHVGNGDYGWISFRQHIWEPMWHRHCASLGQDVVWILPMEAPSSPTPLFFQCSIHKMKYR